MLEDARVSSVRIIVVDSITLTSLVMMTLRVPGI
jgi:hypothetical protein